MNIEQLRKMSESELRSKADAALADMDSESVSDQAKGERVAQAQFYLAELGIRKQEQERIESEKIAQRDYKLELWVIGLIGAELLLAFVGIALGWVEGNKQMEVLDKLNQSAAATAATLTAVRQAQEASLDTQKHTLENIVAMNNSLRDEMDLNFADALQYTGGMSGGGQQQVVFANSGRTTLFVWGSAFGQGPPNMQQKATVLVPGNSVSFDISQVVEKLLKMKGGSNDMSVPFTLFLKRENGTQYLSKGSFKLNPQNSFLSVDGRVTTSRKRW
jgi:hypothetical protein